MRYCGWISLATLLLGSVTSDVARAASFRTQNFVVEAPTAESAQKFGQMAEVYRKEKATQWLGKEMPNWPQACPLNVSITMSGAGGATSFNFTNGNVSQSMQIEGSYERLLNSVLPHEVTHTVFAHHFRRPVPRWADEGGSVLSEDDVERHRHDGMCRSQLNAGKAMPLRRLFSLTEYPSDVMVLYAQGFSVTRYLVDLGDRQKFLGFVGTGLTAGWDRAAQEVYNFKSVEELQSAWIESLRTPRKQPRPASDSETAKATGVGPAPGELTSMVNERRTAPPSPPELMPPTLGLPIARGQAPTEPASAYPGRAEPYPEVRPGAPSPTGQRPVVQLLPVER